MRGMRVGLGWVRVWVVVVVLVGGCDVCWLGGVVWWWWCWLGCVMLVVWCCVVVCVCGVVWVVVWVMWCGGGGVGWKDEWKDGWLDGIRDRRCWVLGARYDSCLV